MKKIKIFCLPSHQTKERTSGVDMVRIIQPMQHLDKHKDFEVTIFDIHNKDHDDPTKTRWDNVAEEHDIIYLNYIGNAWAFAAMGAMARKYNRKIVFDLDDDLWGIGEDNPAYKVYHTGSEALKNFTSMCNEVDYMTTTNLYLKHVIAHNTYKKHDKIKIFPNYIDFKLYNHRPKFKDTPKIQLLHFGSTTHFLSLQNEEFMKGIDKIFKEFPNVTLKTVGAFLPKYKAKWGERYENALGHQDVYKWIKDKFPGYMDEADIIVAPLEDNLYNRCKSDIKRTESASAKKPFIGQDLRQYKEVIDDGVDGFIAGSEEDWYQKIRALIEDKKLRKSMGEAGFKRVSETRQMKDHVQDYADFFKEILS